MRARDEDWAEAKRLCRLSAEDVRMARALGLNPRKLIKNIPNPKERWKAPVRDWVRELYRQRFGGPASAAPAATPSGATVEPHELEIYELEESAAEGDSWLVPSNVPHLVTALEDSVAIDIFSPPREEYK